MNSTSKIQKDAPYDYAPWQPPFRYDSDGSMVVDANSNLIVDVRGWGYLTGSGSLGMDETEAALLQDRLGEHVTKLLNLTSVGRGNENQPAHPLSQEQLEISALRSQLQEVSERNLLLMLESDMWRDRCQTAREALEKIIHECMCDHAVDADTTVSRVNKIAVNARTAIGKLEQPLGIKEPESEPVATKTEVPY